RTALTRNWSRCTCCVASRGRPRGPLRCCVRPPRPPASAVRLTLRPGTCAGRGPVAVCGAPATPAADRGPQATAAESRRRARADPPPAGERTALLLGLGLA